MKVVNLNELQGLLNILAVNVSLGKNHRQNDMLDELYLKRFSIMSQFYCCLYNSDELKQSQSILKLNSIDTHDPSTYCKLLRSKTDIHVMPDISDLHTDFQIIDLVQTYMKTDSIERLYRYDIVTRELKRSTDKKNFNLIESKSQ